MKTRTILITLLALGVSSLAILAANAWVSPYFYLSPYAQPACGSPATGIPQPSGAGPGGQTSSVLGCPGCPSCPGENNSTPPGGPGCMSFSLGCPGCPGCPGNNNTTPPGGPGCY